MRISTALPIAAAAALLSSCSLRLPVKNNAALDPRLPEPETTTVSASGRSPDVLVWMIANDFHTGMVIPFDWLVESGFVPPEGFGSPRCVAMSWGNTDAYSEEGIGGVPGLMRVLLTPTPSVMELIEVNWDVAEVCPQMRIWRGLVGREYGPRIAAYLNGCSRQGPDGRPIVVRPSSWGKGVQLESRHSYFIPRVCNVWTAQAIESMGGDINPWFGLTADGLVKQIERSPNNYELIWPGRPKEE